MSSVPKENITNGNSTNGNSTNKKSISSLMISPKFASVQPTTKTETFNKFNNKNFNEIVTEIGNSTSIISGTNMSTTTQTKSIMNASGSSGAVVNFAPEPGLKRTSTITFSGVKVASVTASTQANIDNLPGDGDTSKYINRYNEISIESDQITQEVKIKVRSEERRVGKEWSES